MSDSRENKRNGSELSVQRIASVELDMYRFQDTKSHGRTPVSIFTEKEKERELRCYVLHDGPTDVTHEEIEFGFVVTQTSSTNRRLVVAKIRSGLRAIKVLHSGTAHYLVCNDRLAPLYSAAASLDEWRERFPR